MEENYNTTRDEIYFLLEFPKKKLYLPPSAAKTAASKLPIPTWNPWSPAHKCLALPLSAYEKREKNLKHSIKK
jgi:hypothetical protein